MNRGLLLVMNGGVGMRGVGGEGFAVRMGDAGFFWIHFVGDLELNWWK